MLTYVMSAPGELVQAEVADPVCGPDEVLLQTEAVSVCSTDISYFRGHLVPEQWPIVPGHEYVGRAVEVGKRLAGLVVPGDRLTYWGQTDFGGLAEYRALRPLFPTHDPESERIWHTERNFYDSAQAAAVVVPHGVPSDHATLTEPLISVLRSVLVNPPRPGDTVVLLGCGPSGLLALQVLIRCMGVGQVVVVDRNQQRLNVALQLGATRAFNALHQADELEAFIQQHRDHFADYAFDALPHVEFDGQGRDVRELGMMLLRPGGAYVVYGATALPQSIRTWLILAKGLRVQAAPFDVRAFPMSRTSHVARTALGLIERGVIDVASLLTGQVDFSDADAVHAVFASYGEGLSLKTSIAVGSGAPSPEGVAASAPA
ncbi:MAG TPA: zinc-binding dehydrogenase [Pilimelia sp.]|nr:zinc-binding dehydrogenase [Pilimelia sp.]